ncbi:uncharacterized protein LOC124595489 [Schistocerca americana]|uniref:uncharacterized protein LOC124595489 n=1 Tax=Schistocerca americana TaxID=7009 RepID=UPI001F501D09|nr:uncharacterized protein LOC124595489 [Schistocerca americana]
MYGRGLWLQLAALLAAAALASTNSTLNSSSNSSSPVSSGRVPSSSERFRRLIPYMTYYITQQSVAARPAAAPLPIGFYRPVTQFTGNSLYKPSPTARPQPSLPPPPLAPIPAPTPVYNAPYPQSSGDARLNALVRILAILHQARNSPQATPNAGIQALAQILAILQQSNALPAGSEAGVSAAIRPHLQQQNYHKTPAVTVYHNGHPAPAIPASTPVPTENPSTATVPQQLLVAISPRPFAFTPGPPSVTPSTLPEHVEEENDLPAYDDDDDDDDNSSTSGDYTTKEEIANHSPDRYAAKLPHGFKPQNYYGGVTSTQIFPDPYSDGSTPGRAGVDYPTYSTIPQTSFSCKTQRYKGFFGDPETSCQVWHYCDLNGGQASFLCPNGTIFSQVALTCDWWFNVRCSSTTQLYVLNERLYKYILPVTPSFPEDFHGPLVDQYIALKFQEQEKKKQSKLKTTTSNPKKN